MSVCLYFWGHPRGEREFHGVDGVSLNGCCPARSQPLSLSFAGNGSPPYYCNPPHTNHPHPLNQASHST